MGDEYRCYVGNLSYNVDDDMLRDTFHKFNVVDARVITDRETGRSRGFGFVTLSNEDDMEKAIEELNDTDCDGRCMRVNKANSRGERSGGGGGGFRGGRGGGGYRGGRGGGYGRGGGFGRDRDYGGGRDYGQQRSSYGRDGW